jgi:hypothetical protein
MALVALAISIAATTLIFIVPVGARRSFLEFLGSVRDLNFKPVCSSHALKIAASSG